MSFTMLNLYWGQLAEKVHDGIIIGGENYFLRSFLYIRSETTPEMWIRVWISNEKDNVNIAEAEGSIVNYNVPRAIVDKLNEMGN